MTDGKVTEFLLNFDVTTAESPTEDRSGVTGRHSALDDLAGLVINPTEQAEETSVSGTLSTTPCDTPDVFADLLSITNDKNTQERSDDCFTLRASESQASDPQWYTTPISDPGGQITQVSSPSKSSTRSTKQSKTYKPEYYALQAAEEQNKSVRRARIQELEEEVRVLKKSLKYKDVLNNEINEQREEIRRLIDRQISFDAIQLEVLSCRNAKQFATRKAEKAASLESSFRSMQNKWKQEKIDMLYWWESIAEQWRDEKRALMNSVKQKDEDNTNLRQRLQVCSSIIKNNLTFLT